MEQESWNMGKEETGRLPPEGPKLCANNCGFFGSAITMNLCSQCYRDTVMKQTKAAATSSTTTCQPSNLHSELGEASSESKEVASELLELSSTSSKKIPSRCFTCKKRLGLTGFKCRCGNQFCSLHRYHEKHECTFDYRAAAQEAISKANPVIKADRIEKI